jgi:hypothetical protein
MSTINTTVYPPNATQTTGGHTTQVLTANGTGGLSWNPPQTTITNGVYNPPIVQSGILPLTTTSSSVQFTDFQKRVMVLDDIDIKGNITLQGINLSKRLEEIEKRINILQRNEILEEKWNELKELGTQYRKLEKEIIEKELIWDIMKK